MQCTMLDIVFLHPGEALGREFFLKKKKEEKKEKKKRRREPPKPNSMNKLYFFSLRKVL